MRKLLLVFLLVLTPVVFAAEHAESSDAAHGAPAAHASDKTWGVPNWILKTVNMLLFIGALVYFLRRPVASAMNERRESIRRAAEEAKERRIKADQLASDIQARLTAIEGEVRAIQERAVAEGERQKRDLVAAAEAEAAKILQQARNEVDNRLKHAKHELTEYAGELAAERAEQILRQEITEDDQRRLFQDSLRQVTEVRS